MSTDVRPQKINQSRSGCLSKILCVFKFQSLNPMQLKYGSQKLVLENKRNRITDKKYKCIRNYDGGWDEVNQLGGC